jgi:hypothetical protein
MQTPAQNESTVAMQLQHLLRNLDQFKLAPENNIYHNDFEQSLTRSPTWLSAEEIAARLASPTESSSRSSPTESKLLPPPDRWVLLLSKVTLSCESGDIMTATENEFFTGTGCGCASTQAITTPSAGRSMPTTLLSWCSRFPAPKSPARGVRPMA